MKLRGKEFESRAIFVQLADDNEIKEQCLGSTKINWKMSLNFKWISCEMTHRKLREFPLKIIFANSKDFNGEFLTIFCLHRFFLLLFHLDLTLRIKSCKKIQSKLLEALIENFDVAFARSISKVFVPANLFKYEKWFVQPTNLKNATQKSYFLLSSPTAPNIFFSQHKASNVRRVCWTSLTDFSRWLRALSVFATFSC